MFKKRVDEFFDAIKSRDTMEIGNFLHESKAVRLILSNGALISNNMDFLSHYDEWFSNQDWSLAHEVMTLDEEAHKGNCLVKVTYRGADEMGVPFENLFYMQLDFEKIDDDWYLIQDQNTLIKPCKSKKD